MKINWRTHFFDLQTFEDFLEWLSCQSGLDCCDCRHYYKRGGECHECDCEKYVLNQMSDFGFVRVGEEEGQIRRLIRILEEKENEK